jgi:hypothetical protein
LYAPNATELASGNIGAALTFPTSQVILVVQHVGLDRFDDGIVAFEFDTCVGGGELPIHAAAGGITVVLPSSDFRRDRFTVG